jgi:hypothetical protein
VNHHAYIESGILETYVLGLASDVQQDEVERYAQIFPEVSLALKDVETAINQQFSASIPPPSVRQRIQENELNRLKKWDFNDQSHNKNTKEENKYLEVEVNDTHIRVHKNWRPAFIAVFILSKIFLATALYFYFKSDSLNKENLKLQQEIQLLKN